MTITRKQRRMLVHAVQTMAECIDVFEPRHVPQTFIDEWYAATDDNHRVVLASILRRLRKSHSFRIECKKRVRTTFKAIAKNPKRYYFR